MAPTGKSQYYPVRSYRSVDEIRVGDVVRMRHNDETHGGINPAFDDSIVLSIDANQYVTLARPYVSLRDGQVQQHLGTFSVEGGRLIQAFDVLTRGASGEIDNRVDEQQYAVRFVHKISPSDKDTHPPIALLHGVFEDIKVLAAALKTVGILPGNGSVTECRYEDGRYVVFPRVPGMTTFWHAIVLEFIPPEKRVPAEYA